MAALTLVGAPEPETPELDDCVDCDGDGEYATSQRDPFTGLAVVRDCPSCSGSGQVEAVSVATCTVCTVRFWRGEGCHHGVDDLCLDCRGGCDQCLSQARYDAGMEELRERVLKAGGWS